MPTVGKTVIKAAELDRYIGNVIEFDDFEGEHHKGMLMRELYKNQGYAKYRLIQSKYDFVFRKSHVKGDITVYSEKMS